MAEQPGFALRSARKEFGPTVAVRGLDLRVEPATVHALVGENGAGKSTAAQMLAGVHQLTSGELEIDGERLVLSSAVDAEAHGIVLVPQELQLYPSLTVAENIFIGRARPRNRAGLISSRAMQRRAKEVLQRIAPDIAPSELVENLAYGARQLVTIARALTSDVRLVIMDEPTAALDEWESARLLEVVRDLRRNGVAVLYVSHRMHEITEIADTISVMRDGVLVSTGPVSDYTPASLVEQMVGRQIELRARAGGSATERVLLRVDGMSQPPFFKDVSFEVRAGEVLGIAGIVGSGRSELALAVYGRAKAAGAVAIDGQPVPRRSVRRSISLGLGLVPEERQSQGLFLPLDVRTNVSILDMRRLRRWGLLSPGKEQGFAASAMSRFSFKRELSEPASALSGGNQQKVLLARSFASEPKVVILDEPTRGIDVGARSEIYEVIDEMAARGTAIVVISSDIQEVLLLSDRILVMRNGEIAAELEGEDRTELRVGAAALGEAADR